MARIWANFIMIRARKIVKYGVEDNDKLLRIQYDN